MDTKRRAVIAAFNMALFIVFIFPVTLGYLWLSHRYMMPFAIKVLVKVFVMFGVLVPVIFVAEYWHLGKQSRKAKK